MRQWDIDFTKDAVNFEPFDKSFEYLDVQKLRSLFIPEQAFLEGKGGTSSRNVAAEMGNSFLESQAVLSAQIQETINRFLIPQWLAVNYPEFSTAGGTAEIVVQGFAEEDTEFMRQLVQLLGQQEAGAQEIIKLVDLQKVLEDRGTPIVPYAEQQRRDQDLANDQQAQGVGQVEPIPGEQVGTVPTQNGFSYIQPREVIYLSDSDSEFLSSLPDSPHFSSKKTRLAARDLYERLSNFYASEYNYYIDRIGSPHDVDLDSTGIVNAVSDITDIFSAAFSDDELAKESAVRLVSKATETVRSEVHNLFNDADQDGPSSFDEIARLHFMDFPAWHSKSDTVGAIRDIYNQEVILSAKADGSDILVAIEEGSDIDGAMFTLEEASELDADPNRMIAWKPLPFNFEIERSDEFTGAVFDEETMTLSLSDNIDADAERKIIKSVLAEL
jgi:hypothetical protein